MRISLLEALRRLRGAAGSPSSYAPAPPSPQPSRLVEPVVERPTIELRIPASTFATMRDHVEDTRLGEEVGFLVCSIARRPGAVALLARQWHSVPSEAVSRNSDGYVSSWPADVNSRVVSGALSLDGTVVLFHSHGAAPAPVLSPPDRKNARAIFPSISRILAGRPTGTVVLGDGAASGLFWQDGVEVGSLTELKVVGAPLATWLPRPRATLERRPRLARQTIALGRQSDRDLAESSVAVIGASGGGSHLCQQLAFQGVGKILAIDDDIVKDVNGGRMIGSRPGDVETTGKVAVMERMIAEIDPTIDHRGIPERFPTPKILDALKSVDVVVACVDRFDVRAQINAFCRRHHLPLVDVGLNIETDQNDHLRRADGQVICVLPDSPCLQCTPLLSDAVLEQERRERPPGYDLNPDAEGDPQVVSMNGTLASEACNIVLDLITGYSDGARGAGWWQYDGRRGELCRADLPPHRESCPACAEAGLGDPTF